MEPFNIRNDQVYLMPQGITPEQLQEKAKEMFDLCAKEGYNYTPRLHVDVYGDKRGI